MKKSSFYFLYVNVTFKKYKQRKKSKNLEKKIDEDEEKRKQMLRNNLIYMSNKLKENNFVC